MERTFPFVPKSSAKLLAGDYWGIPLQNGTFACGRVLEHLPKGMPGHRVGFLGAVLDWNGTTVPSETSIAGATIYKQGVMHILAITSTGQAVLGNRSLATDNLKPLLFVHNDSVYEGFGLKVRSWTQADGQKIPGLSWWSYDMPQVFAEQRWGGGAASA